MILVAIDGLLGATVTNLAHLGHPLGLVELLGIPNSRVLLDLDVATRTYGSGMVIPKLHSWLPKTLSAQ